MKDVFKAKSIFNKRCAILSKFRMEPIESQDKKKKTWHAMARISFEDGKDPICVNCVQLRATSETFRLTELKLIEEAFNLVKGQGQIWAGDLNSLSLSDYDSRALKAIAAERKAGRLESPKGLVTDRMTSKGLTDARSVAEDVQGPLATVKNGTRTDFVFCDDNLMERWKVQSVRHVETAASPHNMVVVELHDIFTN